MNLGGRKRILNLNDVDESTGQSASSANSTYDIEEILDHRRGANGCMEYYVKWLGFGASSNTWEPSFNFMSPETISEYHERLERKQLKMKDKRHKTAMSNGNNENLQEMFTKSRRTSCMPEKVLNIYQDENGELICLLAFKGQSHPTYVPAEWANVTCPELVIKFYEGRIYWSLDDNKLIKHINENN